MSRSLRFKACLYMVVTVLVFIILAMVISLFGFQRYYESEKTMALLELAEQMSEVYQGHRDGYEEEITRTANIWGTTILVLKGNEIAYISRAEDRETEQTRRLHGHMAKINVQNRIADVLRVAQWEDFGSRAKKSITIEGARQVRFINLLYPIDRTTYVLIRQPLLPIEEGVSITIQFMYIAGAICLFFGLVGAWIFAGRLTAPMRKMNEIALGMAKLDFSRKWESGRKDEIGTLGESLNHLSEHLEKTIENLNTVNAKLEKELKKVREMDQMRKEFLSSVSHELKTPLAIIQGYAEGLESGIAENAQARQKYCSVIVKETEKMDALVKDLLRLSRAESKMFTLDWTAFDLREVVSETAAAFSHVFEEKKISFSMELSAPLPVWGDPFRIGQVVQTILSNAIDHTAPEGRIRLWAEEREQGYILRVWNEGCAIPEEELQKIWEPFYKLDKARTRKFGGHGLGLSIVKAILELHGQTCGAVNENDGVTFWMTIGKERPNKEQ